MGGEISKKFECGFENKKLKRVGGFIVDSLRHLRLAGLPEPTSSSKTNGSVNGGYPFEYKLKTGCLPSTFLLTLFVKCDRLQPNDHRELKAPAVCEGISTFDGRNALVFDSKDNRRSAFLT